jgi:putative toxin-antitoxin system antitoxin component (TIGR02293 family)
MAKKEIKIQDQKAKELNELNLKLPLRSENDLIAPYQPYYTNPITVLTHSKKGLSAKAALDFISLSGFSKEEFQETFKTTVKTIQNYENNDLKLDPSLSEKLLKSFALFDKGIEVFGSAKLFHLWLNTPAFGLGNQIPFDLMDTITGITLIEEELIRIEFGDLA